MILKKSLPSCDWFILEVKDSSLGCGPDAHGPMTSNATVAAGSKTVSVASISFMER